MLILCPRDGSQLKLIQQFQKLDSTQNALQEYHVSPTARTPAASNKKASSPCRVHLLLTFQILVSGATKFSFSEFCWRITRHRAHLKYRASKRHPFKENKFSSPIVTYKQSSEESMSHHQDLIIVYLAKE